MTELKYSIAHRSRQPTLPNGEFVRLAQMINKQAAIGKMLETTPESLMQSYSAGLSEVILNDSGEAVGHVRFTPLLTAELRTQLGLPDDFPLMHEIGGGIIAEEFRRHQLYPQLRRKLLEDANGHVKNGELIIIGTTKALQVVNALDDANDLVDTMVTPHTNKLLSAFTCTCDRPHIGAGYPQGIDACPMRMSNETFVSIAPEHKTELWQDDLKNTPFASVAGGEKKTSLACVMYIQGNRPAIERAEQTLVQQFGSLEGLVARLRQPDIDYYNEMRPAN